MEAGRAAPGILRTLEGWQFDTATGSATVSYTHLDVYKRQDRRSRAVAIEVRMKKKLGNFQLDIDFKTDENRIGILGASGCGKSMTLKCIAGIETPDEGRIIVDGTLLYDSAKKISLKPQKRHIGYLFQNYALFPTMTVEENIAAGLQLSLIHI